MMNVIRWHYTIGERLRDIQSAGVIRPATAFVQAGEVPVVWFTESPAWEPTTSKMWRDGPGSPVRSLDRAETARRGGGLVRIGVLPESAPHRYRDFARITRTNAATVRRLTGSARSRGSVVRLWYFSVEPVTADAWVAIEGYNDATGWHPIP